MHRRSSLGLLSVSIVATFVFAACALVPTMAFAEDAPYAVRPDPSALPFAVERDDGTIVSSVQVSQILGKVPKAVFDYVFVAPEILDDARTWLSANLETILATKEPS